MKKNKKIKTGVIGLGKMGILHASILNVIPNIKLEALCDKSWIMRKLAKNTIKDTIVTNNLKDLENLNLDVLYVTTPIPSHYRIIQEIYNNKLAPNLFVEKTLSSNYNQSMELCKLAEKSKGHNMVGYMKRFSVTFRKVKDLLDQGLLDRIYSFDAYAYSSDFFNAQSNKASSSRGGVLEDLGSHVCDLALWLFNDSLSSIKISSSTHKGDSVYFDIIGLNDFTGSFDISWVKDGFRMPEFGLKIYGNNGTIRVDDNTIVIELKTGGSKIYYRHDLEDHVSFLLGDSEYYREDYHFINSIISQEKNILNFNDAAKVDNLLEQVKVNVNE